MKPIITIFIFITFHSFSQNLKEFETKTEMDFDFGIQVQNDWKERNQLFNDLESEKRSWENLTKKESELLEKYNETYNSMWDIEGGGCSWYCGAGDYTVRSSSYLKNQNKNSYEINNIKDFSYQTAWVEGVKGYGIGEFIEFIFVPKHPRVTVIKIANGYIKSKEIWKNNSRVKKLKMYFNDVLYGIINLKDVYSLQSIELEKPIGYSERKDYKKLQTLSKWKIKFEILEIYKGDKYDDTAITEIFFDGIDIH
ncbi:NADase-type glycan-binding domain-containing protein [Flavicella sediminum]|uniref:NADase-type glycan-binding domain-containing protein n=1 Tax=Flavicella sediminum TaxID=2585141 RepID=UPI00111F51E2|nr:hypothetical protein [Flavicella sediminum]